MTDRTNYQQELETIKKKVETLRSEMSSLKEAFEDHILTEEEKEMIDSAAKAKKESKLFTSKEVFGE